MRLDEANLRKAKIGLACTGLGRILRGFESFTESLFQALRMYAPTTKVTLFQGAGTKTTDRVTVPNFHRSDIPARWLGNHRAGLLEQRSFALFLYPLLLRGGYHIVHYNDLVMGSTLFHLRRSLGGKFKLLYCNGAPSPPLHYHHRCDFAQVLTGPAHERARTFGIPEGRLFLIPYGIDARRFNPDYTSQKTEVRRQLGIPEDAKIVLTVAALKQEHKRLDYLIREISSMDESVWLLAAGQPTEETPLLRNAAERMLPGRWRFLQWPHEQIHLLYGASDVFVLASLTEGFGLVSVEAMLSGLPVVLHDSPHSRWLVGQSPVNLIDMSGQGTLRNCLDKLLDQHSLPSARGDAVARFSWESLVPQYLEMYAIAAASKVNGDGRE